MTQANRTNDDSFGESSPVIGHLNIKVVAVACHVKR